MTSPISCGTWTAQVVGRGGSPVHVEPSIRSLTRTKVLNNYGTAGISIGATECCEVFTTSEPWKDELVLYRDNVLDYAGPILNQTISSEGGGIDSHDLFFWLDNRFFPEDFHGSGDLSEIFREAFEAGYSQDTSPNIDITTRRCGVDGLRDVRQMEYRRPADLMRELARTGLDFTVIGRRILAGGTEVFPDNQSILLHDQACLSVELSREGINFATDVAVFGGSSADNTGELSRTFTATGRAIRDDLRYGLVQKSYTELLIKDGASADANALARLDAMQPAPVRLTATLGPDAAFGYDDLVPGKRVDVRLAEAVGCVEVMQEMRLVEVTVDVEESGIERVSISLIPLGVIEDG